jgi:hypothetical protein
MIGGLELRKDKPQYQAAANVKKISIINGKIFGATKPRNFILDCCH